MVYVAVFVVVVAVAALVLLARGKRQAASATLAGIDPFALSEPWRRFVSDALRSQRRYQELLRGARPGPLRERLADIGDRIDDGVQECWRAARSGHALAKARAQTDLGLTRRRHDELTSSTDDASQTLASSLAAQIASAERLDATIEETRQDLRLLDARLDEAVSRAAELSVSTDTGALDELSDDVDGIVGDLEALRLGLEATNGPL